MSLAAVTEALGAAGRAVVSAKRSVLVSRRELVVTSLVAGFALMFLDGCDKPDNGGKTVPAGTGSAVVHAAVTDGGVPEGEIEVTLDVNGALRKLRIDPRTTLLDALRERLAPHRHEEGLRPRPVRRVHGARRRPARQLVPDARGRCVEGQKITTIEGLAKGDDLHPMQAAFIAHDGFQCGYCTPGQIMSAVALLDEGRAKTRRRGPRADERQHLPLRRVPEHRRRHPDARGRERPDMHPFDYVARRRRDAPRSTPRARAGARSSPAERRSST